MVTSGYTIIWILVAVIAVIGIAVASALLCRKKPVEIKPEESPAALSVEPEQEIALVEQEEEEPEELALCFENLPALMEDEETRLVEVKDKQLLARIDGVIPGTAQLVANAGAVHSYQQAVQNAGQLYQCIIPKGEELVRSKEIAGAVRGFSRNAQGINKQANWIAVDGNMGKGLAAMNVANAAMGVAAMIVGQHYMTQINSKLDELSDGIRQITGFLDKEFKSKVYALVAQVQKCSAFQTEIMENDELRKRQLDTLSALEHECAELLGQANLELQEIAGKSGLSYEDYEKTVSVAQKWYQFQQILLQVMGKIAELTYALNLGAVSKEYCHAICDPYIRQSESTLEGLRTWHLNNAKQHKIDLQKGRRRRKGFDDFVMSIPGLFDYSKHYRKIPGRTVQMIAQQGKRSVEVKPEAGADLFKEDVRLVVKDGKLYYLPPAVSGSVS